MRVVETFPQNQSLSLIFSKHLAHLPEFGLASLPVVTACTDAGKQLLMLLKVFFLVSSNLLDLNQSQLEGDAHKWLMFVN